MNSATVTTRFHDDAKEEVRRATDLVEVVSRYLELRRSGRSFSARCPFHQERTPSFHVFPDSQRWKCFGCGRSGDAFGFVMEREGVSFPEALRMLARERGIEIDPPDPRRSAEARRREAGKQAAYDAAEWACRWFQGNLKGSPAADYLKGRGLTGETALAWRLGYAPPGWQGLLDAAAREGVPVEDLDAAGLVIRRRSGDGFYDRFRHRVVFPIVDVGGRVVAFGARALEEAAGAGPPGSADGESQPKYLNSPETVVFQKGRTLFGLHRARDEALRGRTLAVMEGYMDVIMAHQHGLGHAVAGLGTAFTPDQARLMRRFADRVVLVYDADAAGRRAAERAVEVLFREGLDTRVALLEGAKDPCDLLVAEGRGALDRVLEGARELFDHVVLDAAARHGDSVAGAAAAADEILGFAVRVGDGVKRDLMIERASSALGIPADRLRARARELAAAETRFREPRGDAAPAANGDPAAAGDPPAPGERDPGTPRERLLIEAALAGKGLAGRLKEAAPPESFPTRSMALVARALAETARGDGTADPAACAAALEAAGSPRLADEVAGLAASGLEKEPEALRRHFEDCLAAHVHEDRLARARRRHAEAKAAGRADEATRWMDEVYRILKEKPPRTRSA